MAARQLRSDPDDQLVPASRLTPREARLRHEFAHLYPCLEADVWLPASEVGLRLLAWALDSPVHVVLGPRVLLDEHFEFRGGEARGHLSVVRTRAADAVRAH